MLRSAVPSPLLALLLTAAACTPAKHEYGFGGASSTSSGSGGSEGPTSGTSSLTTGTKTTDTTSTTGDPCLAKPDTQSCYDCLLQAYPSGAQLYNDLAVCIVCTACYTICSGPSAGCNSAPPAKDACDGADCGTCQQCATTATCQQQANACKDSPECMTFYDAISHCPM